MDILKSFTERSKRIEKTKKLARIYAGTAIDYASYIRKEGVNPIFDNRYRQLLSEAERHARSVDQLEKNFVIQFPGITVPLKQNGRWNMSAFVAIGLRSPIIILAFVLSRIFRHI